ncbi:MAG TPA: carboxypeptidase-like regulatory domain-containing protein, partial [Sphingomicrobium sp.]
MNTTQNKGRLASGISAIAIAAALTMAAPAYAQAEFGTVEGHVEGAAAGTQVVAVDKHTGQRSIGTVNANGDYSILGLRPSDYSVSVQGQPVQTTSVLVGQTVTLDFGAARTAA